MTGFLYFVPGSATRLDELRQLGLGYAFDADPTPRGCQSGPGGANGVIVCDERSVPLEKLGYWPARQTWKKHPIRDYWVGMYQEARPTPDDLARPEQIPGEWLKLDDGNKWLAPKARRWEEFDEQLLWLCDLPKRLTLDDSGRWTLGEIKPRYERLWTLAMAYEAAMNEAIVNNGAQPDGTVRFQFDAIDDLAVGCLQTNYRVSVVELDMLGVYDLEARQRIIDVLLDSATWNDWVKKKLAAAAQSGSASSSGPGEPMAAGAADTGRQSPSCGPTLPDSTVTSSPRP